MHDAQAAAYKASAYKSLHDLPMHEQPSSEDISIVVTQDLPSCLSHYTAIKSSTSMNKAKQRLCLQEGALSRSPIKQHRHLRAIADAHLHYREPSDSMSRTLLSSQSSILN
ncbi:hypothetical protein BU23DRAFT_562094 [Bimuria novae-zelandiae CBS 107.79]|uniref:Uncharacterized protein n=1 Tax=Bimuria novae-zelandiae CBS 107.79 TaxID=1447943 RepID=A0A6A5UH63_9PLEO|nr:hypothetical protein BU23DRAFT_562094 [Bimuria novae-zelandiae CBS 107.79]